MTTESSSFGKGPGDLTLPTRLFGLTIVAMIGFMAYQCYLTWSAGQELEPAKLALAPAGCVADRLREEVQKSAKPLTNRTYSSIAEQCDQDAKLNAQRESVRRSDGNG